MKSAEAYYNEQAGRSDMGCNVELSEHEYIDHVRAIQLDAIKEGMRRAAKTIDAPCENPDCFCDWCYIGRQQNKTILSAADALTEKDL